MRDQMYDPFGLVGRFHPADSKCDSCGKYGPTRGGQCPFCFADKKNVSVQISDAGGFRPLITVWVSEGKIGKSRLRKKMERLR